jgi:hypothetical protein
MAATRGRRPARILAVAIVVVAIALAGWLVAGNARAANLARDHFYGALAPGQTAENVTVDGMSAGVPPFWSVDVSGDIHEPGRPGAAYRAHMRLWIEPVSGWVLSQSGG